MENRQSIIFLLFGILICGLLLWLVQCRGWFFSAQNEPVMARFEQELDHLDRVIIERGETRIGLRRQSGRWLMDAPFRATVDQGAVSKFLDAFESMQVKDVLGVQECRKRELTLQSFGLAPSRLQVIFETGAKRTEFVFGSATTLGSNVYARVNSNDQILVLPSTLVEAIPRYADDLRSRKLVGLDRAFLTSFDVRVPGRPFIKFSKESGAWRFIQPLSTAASEIKVEGLLNLLFNARIEHFVWPTISNVLDVAESEVASKTRLRVYGFGLDAEVQLNLQQSGTDVPFKVAFGQELLDMSGLSYTLINGGEAIGVVSNQVVDAFRVSLSALRDTRLFFEKPTALRRLHVALNDVLFVLTKTNDLWRFDAPIFEVADQVAVRDTVERLLQLNADRMDDDILQKDQRANIWQSTAMSQVELFSEQTSWRFSIAPDDAAGLFLSVSFTNSPTRYHVASSQMPAALFSEIGLLGLCSKTVLALPTGTLRRLTIKRENGSGETLERLNREAAWCLVGNGGSRVSTEKVAALSILLERLLAERVEKLGMVLENNATYGFVRPWLEISVDVEAQNAVRKTLLIGNEAGIGKRYAMVRGLDVVFVLGFDDIKVLSVPLLEKLK